MQFQTSATNCNFRCPPWPGLPQPLR